MSPHAVIEDDILSQLDEPLTKFAVSRNAFLPHEYPLSSLPDSYYAPWENLAAELPALIRSRTLRELVSRLPVLKTERLCTEPEWRRAYSVLAFGAHAYIWGDESPAEVLPPAISVPLLRVSEHLLVPPVATYAALNLWNYQARSPSAPPSELDELSALLTFTGTESESWFYTVSVAMEAQAGECIPKALSALRAIPCRDYGTITAAFESVARCIRNVSTLLGRMPEKCEPDIFYNQIRPFLAGSKGMAKAGLPRGVFYDEGNGMGMWRELRGGSNGQSSMIQLFDVILGVSHGASGHSSPHATGKLGPTQERSFHEEVRDYMPDPHRQFLEYVASLGSLRHFALSSRVGDAQRRCKEAYQEAVDALADLRNRHLKIVTRYIVIPSRNTYTGQGRNLASVSSRASAKRGGGENELTGTGGTALLPFLKQSRQETVEARSFQVPDVNTTV
ncbi:indoleamine-dioxygenase [Xylariomycetidae sp. FL0641]|nr:indoleamine-dioxygenase [Xylariomycetidae sp. FL0641]